MGSVQTKAVKKRKGFMKKVGRGCGGVQFGGVVGKFVCFILVYSRFVVVVHDKGKVLHWIGFGGFKASCPAILSMKNHSDL